MPLKSSTTNLQLEKFANWFDNLYDFLQRGHACTVLSPFFCKEDGNDYVDLFRFLVEFAAEPDEAVASPAIPMLHGFRDLWYKK